MGERQTVRITVAPSPHRVQLIIRHDRIQTTVLDIPDDEPCCPTIPRILIEVVDD